MVKKVVHTSDGDKLRDTRTGKLAGSVPKKVKVPQASPLASKPSVEAGSSSVREEYESLLQAKDPFPRECFANYLKDPVGNFEIFKALSEDEDFQVRYAILNNRNTPSSILEEMYKSNNGHTQFLAENPNTPGWILEEIHEGVWELDILVSIRKNPSATPETKAKVDEILQNDHGVTVNDF